MKTEYSSYKLGISIAAIVLMLSGLTINSLMATSSTEGVAKVIVLKGKIKAKTAQGEIFDVTKGMWLKEGTVVQSAPKSFCRLLFIDKSTMNLGADSQMVIDQFPQSDSGIITLMKGQVRSQVTKDYMNIKDKDKSKLFIKTKTAAMGVRGTDFQVNYNPTNTNTSLVTFSGAVAMAQMNEGLANAGLDRTSLERVVSSREAVMVREGELSAVGNTTTRATIPTKMNPVQMESLKKSDPSKEKTASKSDNSKKQFRSPVPPGVDSKKFSNNSKENVKKSLSSTLGQKVNSSENTRSPASSNRAVRSQPEGYRDQATGEYAPPAGSVLDLKTVNIVEPPKNAIYDPISETYLIPPELGSVDPATGEYRAPEGMILTDDGRLIQDDSASGRSPASEDTETKPEVKVNSISPDEESDEETNDDPDVEEELDILVYENEDEIEDDTEQSLIENTRSRTTFEFTRED